MAYFGTGGLDRHQIEASIESIQNELQNGEAYGMNLTYRPMEAEIVDVFLTHGVGNIEASGYVQITPSLVRYRLTGLRRDVDGSLTIANRIMAKVSRPEVAQAFLSPPPQSLVTKLLKANQIAQAEADLAAGVPMADDVCALADGGGPTDQSPAYALMPAILKLRDEVMAEHNYEKRVRVGAGGGIGTPEAAAAAFMLGADFILTGSINQCTVEAGTSTVVKDLLQQMNVQDTAYAPAGDSFETKATVQVLKKGLFFPVRANKLFALYQHYASLDEMDEKTRGQLQEKYFKRTFHEIWAEIKADGSNWNPAEVERAARDPKLKMALVFRWYFDHAMRLALKGSKTQKVDYQVPCGPALGAFNQWIRGSTLEDWRNRHVDDVGARIMEATADLLNQRYRALAAS
jgi:trans-AT polyketide synthase/acyltransferase/oxidoreductase domain-containing protein